MGVVVDQMPPSRSSMRGADRAEEILGRMCRHLTRLSATVEGLRPQDASGTSEGDLQPEVRGLHLPPLVVELGEFDGGVPLTVEQGGDQSEVGGAAVPSVGADGDGGRRARPCTS
ncbi:hypothetical protein GCM10010388_22220 [Streptomyces mauvecolor]